MIIGFGNNVVSSLAADITATQTTIQVMPGAGALFAGLLTYDYANDSNPLKVYAKITLTDAKETVFEVCHLTAVNNDMLMVVRGQEGTAAKGWTLNDVIANFATRGSENQFVQIEQLQSGHYTSGIAGGTANALTVNLPATYSVNGSTDWALRTPLVIYPSQNNTGASSLQLTMGGKVLGTYKLYKGNKAELVANDILKDVALVCLMDKTRTFFTILNPGGIYSSFVPINRKVNGHELSSDVNVTAQDIFNGQAVGIGNAIDLNTFTTAGLYYQPANAQAQTGKNYPETVAGSLEVYKHAGITQIYRVYNGSRAYIRTLYSGTWSVWVMQYDAANKPTATDVSAIPLAGSTGVTGIVRSSAEIQSTSANSFRIAYGGYGVYWRNDGNRLYLMLTNKDDIYGGYNSLRPFYVDLATGKCQFGHDVGFSGNIYGNGVIQPGNYSNFDARYYTKSQTDAAYMGKTGAYTKGESDTRYQLKNTASLGDNGWHRDASTGLITQWMRVNRVGQYLTSFNFPMAFPSKCLAITFGEINTDNRSSQVNIWVYQYSRTGATIRMEEGEQATFIIAKGY